MKQLLIMVGIMVLTAAGAHGQTSACTKICRNYVNGDVKCETQFKGGLASCVVVDECIWEFDPEWGFIYKCEASCEVVNCYDI